MPQLNVDLRYATPSDNTLLAEFGAQTFSDSFGADNHPEDMRIYLSGAFSPEIQAAEIVDPSSVFLIAEIDGQMVGYARLLEGPAPDFIQAIRPVELVRIYASHTWIGRGIGSVLMQGCLDEAARRGCDTIWLGVWERNERAQAFYRRWGFSEAGQHSFLLGTDLQTDLVMSRSV